MSFIIIITASSHSSLVDLFNTGSHFIKRSPRLPVEERMTQNKERVKSSINKYVQQNSQCYTHSRQNIPSDPTFKI